MFPRIGQIVRLNFFDSSEETQAHTFKSRVADIQDDMAAIELPISEKTGRIGVFAPGTQCEVWYVGEDGSRYDFRSCIEGRQNEQIPVLMLRLPPKENVRRTQRRHYLRIATVQDIAVKLEDSTRSYHFLAQTVDLSGGGLSFTCEESYRLKEKDALQIWLSLPSKTGHVFHAFAVMEIVRIKPAAEKGLHQWVSGKFVQISEADRAKVVRACYERQLELRKKGVLE